MNKNNYFKGFICLWSNYDHMKNCKIQVECKGCGNLFLVSPSRKDISVFCTKQCYFNNQDKRKYSVRKTDHPIKIGDCFDKLAVTNIVGAKAHVLCACGQKRVYQSLQLIRGGLKSCGCELFIRKRKNGDDTAWNMWYNYLIQAAKHRNINFNLSINDVKIICKQNCRYCGIEPQPWAGCKNAFIGYYKNRETKPDLIFADSKIINLNGIDRIDSSKSYTHDNVVASCRDCNLAKLDRTVEEFEIWIKRLYEHLFSKTQED